MAATAGSEAVRVRTTETNGVARTLEVEVDATRVSRAYDRAYRELAKRVRVRGFRPGRVPRSVLERLYGAGVAEEVERALVRETLPEAVDRSGLAVVAEPQVDAAPPAPGAAFRYTARVEVKPEIQLADVRGLPGRRPRVQVTDADVERQLEELRQRNAQLLEEPEDGAVATGHVVSVDFVGRIDGKPFEGGVGRDVVVEVGSERFLPGFEEQLVGARADEDREIRVRFPDDTPNADLRGKEAFFAVHVAAIKRREVPALDDEFAKDLGEFDTLEELRVRVRADLTALAERQARAVLHSTLLDALIERNPFEVPPGLVERRLNLRLASAQKRLESSVPSEALQAELARWQEEWRPRAEREVREGLLLEAVARDRGIEVDDADVEQRLEGMAAERGVSTAQLRSSWGSGDLAASVRSQIADERALELLVREAKIEEGSDT